MSPWTNLQALGGLEADAAIAALVALRRTLIFGVRLADLLLCPVSPQRVLPR
jgi:hypothetical protein